MIARVSEIMSNIDAIDVRGRLTPGAEPLLGTSSSLTVFGRAPLRRAVSWNRLRASRVVAASFLLGAKRVL